MQLVCSYRFCNEREWHRHFIGSKRQFDALLCGLKHTLIVDVPQDLAVCNIRLDAIFVTKFIRLFDWQMYVFPTAVGYRRRLFRVSKDAFNPHLLDEFIRGEYVPLQNI